LASGEYVRSGRHRRSIGAAAGPPNGPRWKGCLAIFRPTPTNRPGVERSRCSSKGQRKFVLRRAARRHAHFVYWATIFQLWRMIDRGRTNGGAFVTTDPRILRETPSIGAGRAAIGSGFSRAARKRPRPCRVFPTASWERRVAAVCSRPQFPKASAFYKTGVVYSWPWIKSASFFWTISSMVGRRGERGGVIHFWRAVFSLRRDRGARVACTRSELAGRPGMSKKCDGPFDSRAGLLNPKWRTRNVQEHAFSVHSGGARPGPIGRPGRGEQEAGSSSSIESLGTPRRSDVHSQPAGGPGRLPGGANGITTTQADKVVYIRKKGGRRGHAGGRSDKTYDLARKRRWVYIPGPG